MSSTDQSREDSISEIEERTKARLNELEPLLAQLALKAKETYAFLRPRAKHVGSVDRDYPLRHQQVQGLGLSGPAGVLADYLMVGFGNHHGLTLYNNERNPDRDFRWLFERSFLLEDLLSERTSVKELARPRMPSAGGGTMSIEVATYRYAEQVGLNPYYADGICNSFNGYAKAEENIGYFNADLEQAIARFS